MSWSRIIFFSQSYLRRLQEAAAAAAGQPENSSKNEGESSASPVSPHQVLSSPTLTRLSPSNTPASPPSTYLEPALNPIPSISAPPISIPPSRYPIAADTFHSQSHFSPVNTLPSPTFGNSSRPSEPTTNGHPRHVSPKNEEPSYPSSSDSFGTYPLYNWSYKQHQIHPLNPPLAIPPLSYYYRPHRLEDIAPRDTISLIIALFFDYVRPF